MTAPSSAPGPWPNARSLFNRIVTGTEHNPFAVLGLHAVLEGLEIRAFLPGADAVEAIDPADGSPIVALENLGDGAFAGRLRGRMERFPYLLRCRNAQSEWVVDDPYRFMPVLGELDEHLMAEGTHLDLWSKLGAHPIVHEGVSGVLFAVWAPNAQRVSVVGDFNFWDTRRLPMRRRGMTGIWELFVPNLAAGEKYKYAIRGLHGDELPLKADPVAFGSEHPPQTASIVRRLEPRAWHDEDWMTHRSARQSVTAPISIYEVHLASWQRVMPEGNRPLSYLELARDLVPYVRDMGFTHIELMPISEYPFDGSWGYQPIGLFAPTIRHGTPDEFRTFVETCHQAGLGVLMDWVAGHFPTDAHGLGRFDGTALYEHQDPREGYHPDWNTLVYNYGRFEVANYLTANALYWLKEYRIDGLRVDAVASMLYRDYSRRDGEWIPNVHGGRENLEAIAFLKRVNEMVYRECPGIAMFAEESTAFPGVSHPSHLGGLGFGYKWNMGWMNDTLDYISRDPIHRVHHHHQMTFGIHYGFSENFVLPISHDEVVHGKGSMLGRMPGYEPDRFANLRAYYGFMWAHPGKKLLFMGQEWGQRGEWNYAGTLEWHQLDDPLHAGVRRLVTDLNALYRALPALHAGDCRPEGFEWVEANAANESIFAWLRRDPGGSPPVLIVCNFTPVRRDGWRVGVPEAGRWRQRLATTSARYGGHDEGNQHILETEPMAYQRMPQSMIIDLPPLSTLYFEPLAP